MNKVLLVGLILVLIIGLVAAPGIGKQLPGKMILQPTIYNKLAAKGATSFDVSDLSCSRQSCSFSVSSPLLGTRSASFSTWVKECTDIPVRATTRTLPQHCTQRQMTLEEKQAKQDELISGMMDKFSQQPITRGLSLKIKNGRSIVIGLSGGGIIRN